MASQSPPDEFETLVRSFAEALAAYRNRLSAQPGAEPARIAPPISPWLTVPEAARRARCGVKIIYRAIAEKRLRAAAIGGRGEFRMLPEWIDAWLHTSAEAGGVSERT